jgi:hypothetical protein
MNVLDNPVVRAKDSFKHAVEIHQPFGGLDGVIAWCKEAEMRGEWRWQLVQVSSDHADGCYLFYFDNERDYCAFLLKWGS